MRHVDLIFAIDLAFAFLLARLQTGVRRMLSLPECFHQNIRDFPQLGVPFSGVPIIRTIVFRGLCLGFPI